MSPAAPAWLAPLVEQLQRIDARLAALERQAGAQQAELLTFREAGEALRVSTRTVQRMVRAGTLRTVLVGKAPRVPRADVQGLATPRGPVLTRSPVRPGQGRRPARPGFEKLDAFLGARAKGRRLTEAERIRALAERPAGGPPGAQAPADVGPAQ